jgi:hypothetical protein
MMYPCTSSPKAKMRRAKGIELKKNPTKAIATARKIEKVSHFLIVSIFIVF